MERPRQRRVESKGETKLEWFYPPKAVMQAEARASSRNRRPKEHQPQTWSALVQIYQSEGRDQMLEAIADLERKGFIGHAFKAALERDGVIDSSELLTQDEPELFAAPDPEPTPGPTPEPEPAPDNVVDIKSAKKKKSTKKEKASPQETLRELRSIRDSWIEERDRLIANIQKANLSGDQRTVNKLSKILEDAEENLARVEQRIRKIEKELRPKIEVDPDTGEPHVRASQTEVDGDGAGTSRTHENEPTVSVDDARLNVDDEPVRRPTTAEIRSRAQEMYDAIVARSASPENMELLIGGAIRSLAEAAGPNPIGDFEWLRKNFVADGYAPTDIGLLAVALGEVYKQKNGAEPDTTEGEPIDPDVASAVEDVVTDTDPTPDNIPNKTESSEAETVLAEKKERLAKELAELRKQRAAVMTELKQKKREFTAEKTKHKLNGRVDDPKNPSEKITQYKLLKREYDDLKRRSKFNDPRKQLNAAERTRLAEIEATYSDLFTLGKKLSKVVDRKDAIYVKLKALEEHERDGTFPDEYEPEPAPEPAPTSTPEPEPAPVVPEPEPEPITKTERPASPGFNEINRYAQEIVDAKLYTVAELEDASTPLVSFDKEGDSVRAQLWRKGYNPTDIMALKDAVVLKHREKEEKDANPEPGPVAKTERPPTPSIEDIGVFAQEVVDTNRYTYEELEEASAIYGSVDGSGDTVADQLWNKGYGTVDVTILKGRVYDLYRAKQASQESTTPTKTESQEIGGENPILKALEGADKKLQADWKKFIELWDREDLAPATVNSKWPPIQQALNKRGLKKIKEALIAAGAIKNGKKPKLQDREKLFNLIEDARNPKQEEKETGDDLITPIFETMERLGVMQEQARNHHKNKLTTEGGQARYREFASVLFWNLDPSGTHTFKSPEHRALWDDVVVALAAQGIEPIYPDLTGADKEMEYNQKEFEIDSEQKNSNVPEFTILQVTSIGYKINGVVEQKARVVVSQ